MRELLTRPTADLYRSLVAQTTSRVATRFDTVTQPFSGASRAQLQELVDARRPRRRRLGHGAARCARSTSSSCETRSGSTTRATSPTSTARS